MTGSSLPKHLTEPLERMVFLNLVMVLFSDLSPWWLKDLTLVSMTLLCVGWGLPRCKN